MGNIIRLLISLPEIYRVFKEAWAWMNRVSENRPGELIARAHLVFKTANEAKTQEELIRAAQGVADLLSGRRPPPGVH